MQQVLADYRTAPISEKLRATLALLDAFTLAPSTLSPERVRQTLDVGVTKEELHDAMYVAFLFNTYDRLADTLGWELPAEAYYRKAGTRLLKHGYR